MRADKHTEKRNKTPALSLMTDKEREEHKRLYYHFIENGLSCRQAFAKATDMMTAAQYYGPPDNRVSLFILAIPTY